MVVNSVNKIDAGPFYDDGQIAIYNCDCRDLLPSLTFDLMITDPPYGISLSNHAKGEKGSKRTDRDVTIANDKTQEIGNEVLSLWDGPTIAFCSPMKPWLGDWRQHLCWEKGEHVGGGGDPEKCWKSTFEVLQVRNTGTLEGRRDGAVLRFDAKKEDYKFHPTPKPVALIEYLIVKTQPRIVCDPFMGGGSTLLAAKKCGISAIGIEIEERYCEIAAGRLRQGVLF